MFGLISPNEARVTGHRIAQVAADQFEVAPPLYWVEVPDGTTADGYYFDSAQNAPVVMPPPPAPPPAIAAANQPATSGTQTL